MKVHVICCNDSVEHAVMQFGDDDSVEAHVKQLMAQLAHQHYVRSGLCWTQTRDEYRLRCHWNVQVVEGTSA